MSHCLPTPLLLFLVLLLMHISLCRLIMFSSVLICVWLWCSTKTTTAIIVKHIIRIYFPWISLVFLGVIQGKYHLLFLNFLLAYSLMAYTTPTPAFASCDAATTARWRHLYDMECRQLVLLLRGEGTMIPCFAIRRRSHLSLLLAISVAFIFIMLLSLWLLMCT